MKKFNVLLVFLSFYCSTVWAVWAQCDAPNCAATVVTNQSQQTQVQYGGSPSARASGGQAQAINAPKINTDNRDIVDNRDINDNRHQHIIQDVGNPKLVYAPKTEVANFPSVPSGGFVPNNGYHFPATKAPHNIMGAKELIRFKRIYSRKELMSMVQGKHFKVTLEPIQQATATDTIAVFVAERLPQGKYNKILEVTVVGKGDKETSVSAGATAALWAMAYGANTLLITRDGFDRYFQTRSQGQTASLVGAAINGAKDLAGGLAGLAGFNQLKSEHKALPFVNAIGLIWQPVQNTTQNAANAAHKKTCEWLKKFDPLFDADLYNCQ